MKRLLRLVPAIALCWSCGGSSSDLPPVTPAAPPPAASAQPGEAPDAAPDTPSGEEAALIAKYAARIEPVVAAFTNSQPFLTPNGRKVVFSSSRDGLPQLYVADVAAPRQPPARITTPERALMGKSFDGKSILFLSDHGADENWSLFRADLDGTNVIELTPGVKLQRDFPIAPLRASGSIYFSARSLASPESTIYALDLAGGEPRPVYRDAVQGSLGDVSPDGKLALYVRQTRRTEATLLVVDLAAGTARPIYPKEGQQVTISDARFSADGKRVLVATDGGGEESALLALDTATGAEVARYAEKSTTAGHVDTVEVSPAGNLLAVRIDAGHEAHLRLLDARTLRARRSLAVPTGNGVLGEFSRDGRRLSFTWSTPDRPTDVLLAATSTGKITPLRDEPRPSLAGLPGIEVSSTRVKSFDATVVPVNVYVPAGASGKKLPVIVIYHGGPAGVAKVQWNIGVRFFTSLGYVVLDPNVRGSSGYGRAYEMADNGPRRLDAFKDVEAVGRWAAAQSWADPDRLVVFGGSYGGYTVLIALTRMPDLWRAGVDLFGVVNMHTFLRSTTGYIREVFKLEFGDLEADAAFLDSISPHRDVARIRAPLFVYAGANDPRVPRTESDQIVVALRQRGVPVEYMVAENEGHSLARRENQIELYARVARFLEQHLAGAAE